MQFKIWDSAGQERFKSITTSYYRNADAAIVVYSVDNEESFNSSYRWTKELDRCGKDSLVKVIVGNKSDLESERRVSQQSAVEFALAEDAAVALECSAKENENIELLFEALARKLISQTSGEFGRYPKDNIMSYAKSDPSVEKLITTLQDNTDHNMNLQKQKGFKFPGCGCFRKLCGIC